MNSPTQSETKADSRPAARCAIGLLTWNGERDVVRCVESVRAQTEPVEVRWIDNGSRDGTVARVREAFPDFIEAEGLGENVGFCEGHNRLFGASRAPYYLALNQDVALAPDYVERLCDWMDAEGDLAATSGLILKMEGGECRPGARIYSAGLAMTRRRFPFELAMGREQTPELMEKLRGRRRVPGVTGAAMMVRRAAVERLGEEGRLFPPEFFAYFEEVDLALRIARAGLACGVDGEALAWHAARGQGGRSDAAIRAHYLKNHWLVTLRNDGWGQIARDLPWIAWGEARHYARGYLESPRAAMRGAALAARELGRARRACRMLDAGGTTERVYEESRRLILELS